LRQQRNGRNHRHRYQHDENGVFGHDGSLLIAQAHSSLLRCDFLASAVKLSGRVSEYVADAASKALDHYNECNPDQSNQECILDHGGALIVLQEILDFLQHCFPPFLLVCFSVELRYLCCPAFPTRQLQSSPVFLPAPTFFFDSVAQFTCTMPAWQRLLSNACARNYNQSTSIGTAKVMNID
jgi:hypothetical protein